MNFASVRAISGDVNGLTDFYEAVTRISAVRSQCLPPTHADTLNDDRPPVAKR